MKRSLPFILGGLLLTLGLAMFVSPWADPNPDGLERVAEDHGFTDTARDHDLADSPLADYELRGVGDPRVATGLSGLIGVLVTFGLGLLVFGLLRRRNDRAPAGT